VLAIVVMEKEEDDAEQRGAGARHADDDRSVPSPIDQAIQWSQIGGSFFEFPCASLAPRRKIVRIHESIIADEARSAAGHVAWTLAVAFARDRPHQPRDGLDTLGPE